MEIFKKRETPIQNIAYMAIMAAINIVFILLSNLLPVLLFLLVLVLPLTSTVVTLYCKKKYYPIYAIVTLGLCLAVAGGFTIFDAIIYVFPSLIVGFIFGICFEYHVSAILIIVGATIAQFGLSYLTLFVLEHIITNFAIMNSLITLFRLSEFPFLGTFVIIFVYIIAQIQIVLSYLFIRLEINKIGIEVNLECQNRFLLHSVTFICVLLSILSYLYFPTWTIIFCLIPVNIYVFEVIELLLVKKIYIYVLLGLVHIAFIFVFAFLYQYVLAPNQLFLIIVLFGLVTIIDFSNNYCFIKNNK